MGVSPFEQSVYVPSTWKMLLGVVTDKLDEHIGLYVDIAYKFNNSSFGQMDKMVSSLAHKFFFSRL